MPSLKVDAQQGAFDKDKRLVLAIKDLGVHIGHRCGGNARCTTCRVEFVSGEPEEMTRAEYDKLKDADLLGSVRLSCQLTCSQDMEVKALMTKESEGWPDTGPEPEAQVTPEAEWHSKDELTGA